MILRATAVAVLSVLAGFGSGAGASHTSENNLNPNAWVIGPIIDGRDYSQGVELHPRLSRGGGWYIDLPEAPGSVHYVTFSHGPLAGKSRIIIRYRVEAASGARVVPVTAPQQPSMITAYFQRRGDDWSGEGPHETYRWYATFATQSPITPGEHVIVAPLDGNWTAVETSSARTNPMAFREAIYNADEVGFVLGGGTGYGHGVYATGPARLIVTEFRIE